MIKEQDEKIGTIIQASLEQRPADVKSAVEHLLAQKVLDRVETVKAEIAQTTFGGEKNDDEDTEEQESPEISDDDLEELDLEDLDFEDLPDDSESEDFEYGDSDESEEE